MQKFIILKSSIKFTNNLKVKQGFTLIEVLIALAIIAIALSALLQANSSNILNMLRLKEKNLSHIVAMQAVNMLQLHLTDAKLNTEITKVTTIFGEKWYWRVLLTPTDMPMVEKINIRVSNKQSGPFRDPIIAFRINHEKT